MLIRAARASHQASVHMSTLNLEDVLHKVVKSSANAAGSAKSRSPPRQPDLVRKPQSNPKKPRTAEFPRQAPPARKQPSENKALTGTSGAVPSRLSSASSQWPEPIPGAVLPSFRKSSSRHHAAGSKKPYEKLRPEKPARTHQERGDAPSRLKSIPPARVDSTEAAVSSDDNEDILNEVSLKGQNSLAREILALAASLTPSPVQLNAQNRQLVNTLQRAIDRRPPAVRRYEVVIFGSHCLGIASATSDIDLCIIDHDLPNGYSGTEHHVKLPKEYNVFHIRNKISNIQHEILDLKSVYAVPAKVPIVKLELGSGLQADINTNEQLGVRNSHLLRTYFKIASHLLYPLSRTIKCWAKQRRLNDPGGHKGLVSLSSYSYILLLVSYLQIIGVLPNLQSQTQYEPREEVEADIWWQLEATRRDRGRKASAKLKSTGYSTFYQRNVPPGFVPTEIPLDEALKGFFRYYADFDFDQKIISIRNDEHVLTRRFPASYSVSLSHPDKIPDEVNDANLGTEAEAEDMEVDVAPAADRSEAVEAKVDMQDALFEAQLDSNRSQELQADLDTEEENQPEEISDAEEVSVVLAVEQEVQQQNITREFLEVPSWSNQPIAVLDPFLLTRNTTGNVNAVVAGRFIAELKRADRLLSEGASLSVLCAPLKREADYKPDEPYRKASRLPKQSKEIRTPTVTTDAPMKLDVAVEGSSTPSKAVSVPDLA